MTSIFGYILFDAQKFSISWIPLVPPPPRMHAEFTWKANHRQYTTNFQKRWVGIERVVTHNSVKLSIMKCKELFRASICFSSNDMTKLSAPRRLMA